MAEEAAAAGGASAGPAPPAGVAGADAVPAAPSGAVAPATGPGAAPAAISPGKHVEVVGTAMAGSIGVAEEFLEAKGRWKVTFASGVAKNFKEDSLRLVPEGRLPKAAARRPQDASTVVNTHEGSMDRGSRRADKKLPFVGGIMDVLSRMQTDTAQREEVTPSVADPARAPDPAPAAAPAAAPPAPAAAAAAPPPPVTAAEAEVSSAPAAAAPAEAAPAEAAPSAADAGGVNLAGRTFAGRAALVEHIKAMQARLEERGGVPGEAGVLEGEDRYLFFHLALRHPATAQKMRAPVRGFRYGVHHLFPKAKCFVLVFNDGNEEPISWAKCVKEIFSAAGGEAQAAKRPRADNGGAQPRPGGAAGAKKAKTAEEPKE